MNNLKWMGHTSTIMEIQKSLRNDLTTCDITLSSKGKSVKAHRFVLSATSDLLRVILHDIPFSQEATIVIPDTKAHILDNIISFIYTGEACLSSSNLSDFLECTNLLGIKSAINFECHDGEKGKTVVEIVEPESDYMGMDEDSVIIPDKDPPEVISK